MKVTMKTMIIVWFVFFICTPAYATLPVLKNNLVQLTGTLKALEEMLSREAQKNQQIVEAQRKQAAFEQEQKERKRAQGELRVQQVKEQQERERQAAARKRLEEQVEREKYERKEEQKRLVQIQREREAEAKRQEELRLQEEQELQQALDESRLEEQQRIEREEQQKRLVLEQREREAEVRRQEELRLQQAREQQERERQAAEKRRVEEQARIEREKREQQELERRKLEEQKKLPFSRITAVPYDSNGDWVDTFVEQIDGSSEIAAYFFGGYIFLGSPLLIKGVRTSPGDDSELTLKSYYNAPKSTTEERLKKIKEDLVGLYKIHLMPKNSNDFMIILEQLLKALGRNPALQKAVNTLKVISGFDFEGNPEMLKKKLLEQHGNEVPPIIVIAPSLGKENAQFVLDTVYDLFKNIEGLDLTPRFNEKITSLIYYAQGNGDDKISREEYFDKNNGKIFYKSDFEGAKLNRDYHLENPVGKFR